MRSAQGIVVCLMSIGIAGAANAATIDTTPGWTGDGYVFSSAQNPGGTKYGQVFTTPLTTNILNSFTFFISGSIPPIEFTGEIAQWDPATFETGPLLYESGVVSNAGYPVYTSFISGYETVTFTLPNGLPLIPAAQYAAILDVPFGTGSAAIGNNFEADAYQSGYHLFWSGSSWFNASDTRDYAFLATLSAPSPAPEPASAAVLATGLLLLAYQCARKSSDITGSSLRSGP